MHLAPGVHDLSLTYDRDEGKMTIHPAAVETPRGLLVIDVGLDKGILSEALSDHDFHLSDITSILATHHDGDHVAALHDVVSASEGTVLAHREATPFIDGRQNPVKGERRGEPTPVDIQLVDGVRLRTHAGPVEVVFTPGHAPGHVSLYFADHRLLLAGDALTAGPDGLRGPNPAFTPNEEQALDSVERLSEFDIDRILCYHGGVVEPREGELKDILTER